MNLLRFEWTKLWRQKKLIVIFLIVALGVSAIYFPLGIPMKKKKERANDETSLMINHVDELYGQLYQLKISEGLSEIQEEQFEQVNNMATDLFHRTSSVYNERWGEIPENEQSFLTHLHAYEEAEGVFTALEGAAKEQFIQRNTWMIEHNLAYDDELNPTSPALFIKHNATILFSLAGVLFLLILFGNLITREKEQKTWQTLQTQPISTWKVIYTKYLISFIGLLTFIASVFAVSLFISMVFSDYSLNFQYPQLVMSGESFTFISTTEYLVRHILLFSVAVLFSFSVVFFISKFIHNTFAAILMTVLVLGIGLFLTDSFNSLQVSLNPFQVFQFQSILEQIPKWTDILYPIFALIWSLVILVLTVIIPDKEFRLLNVKENFKPFRLGKTTFRNASTLIITRFEWRKTKRNVLIKQLFLIMALFVVIGYFVLEKEANLKEELYLDGLKSYIELDQSDYLSWEYESLEQNQELLQDAKDEDDKFLISLYEDQLEMIEEWIERAHEDRKLTISAIEGIEENKWLPLYEKQLNDNKSWYNFDSTGDISKFTIEANIAEKEWLIEHNIQPVFFGDFQTTIYDYFDENDADAKKHYDESFNKVDHSALFSLYIYITKYFYFIPIVLFLFLFGAGFANERGKKMTLNFLKTEPIKPNQIILGKSIFAIVISIISGAALISFVTFIATIFNRFGDWKYPILHFDSKKYIDTLEEYEGIRKFEGAGHFMNLGDYLISSFGLFFSILLFLIGLSILLSVFFKRHVIVFGLSLLIAGLGYYLSRLFMDDRAHLSPFTYLNIGEIANGERGALLDNPHLTVQTGCLILILVAILFFVLSYLLASLRGGLTKNNSQKGERR